MQACGADQFVEFCMRIGLWIFVWMQIGMWVVWCAGKLVCGFMQMDVWNFVRVDP